MTPPWPRAAERLLITLWVGSLWAVGYLAVPVLFKQLADRQLAGMLAGEMFHLVGWIGLVCGGVLLIMALRRAHHGAWYRQRRVIVIGLMLVLVAVGMFVLQPMMQELKQAGLVPGSEAAARFGALHGVSSVLYLITSLLGVWLVLMRDTANRGLTLGTGRTFSFRD